MTQIRGEQIRYINIAQVTSDPVSPQNGQTWVLENNHTGSPIGLLLSLTYTGFSTYQLSYKTSAGTIIRQTLA